MGFPVDSGGPVGEGIGRSGKVYSGRVLVVEDILVNREVMAGMLRGLDVAFDVVDNGEDALGLVESRIYSLVFMDVQMPVMDGLQTTRRIREMEKRLGWPRMPVIALTALVIGGDCRECREAGMDDLLEKPVMRKSLREKLRRWEVGSIFVEASASTVDAVKGIVDEGALAQLKELLASVPGRYRMVLERYLESAHTLLREMGLHLDAGHAEGVYRAAHQLKSQSGSVGVMALSTLCSRIEVLGRQGQLGEVADLLAQSLLVLSQAEPVLQQEISRS
ncbi:MAG: multi-sensor hybrid histidine kinase [Magnetococcales bacterium]|nr:multi-sensor hybrid histidine kinase [Magnetococcales bacterium]